MAANLATGVRKAELLGCDAALSSLLSLAASLPAISADLAECDGRYLAEDVIALLSKPSADLSTMDGYALRFAELPGPFQVSMQSAAGRPSTQPLPPGQAARIFTGALIPEGADTVALQEDARLEGDLLSIANTGPTETGANIRRRGFDFEQGRLLLRRGDQLNSASLGLLAAAGLSRLSVHRQPRIALLSTGDELVPPGTTPGPGQIIDANSLMVAALLRRSGAKVDCIGPIPDQKAPLRQAIEEARNADLIVTIGGASVGDHDLVKPALVAAGGEIAFWKLALRPGKPLLAGQLGGVPVVGLPGNPAAAFVCTRVLLWPMLRKLAGSRAPVEEPENAILGTDIAENGPRRHYMRATVAGGRIVPAQSQDSGLLRILATSNALLIRPEHAPPAIMGETVRYLPI